MKIGLDFDGVIFDCGKLKSDGARKIYGKEISPALFKKELVIGSGLLTASEYRELQKLIYGTREYGLLAEPVAGVLCYLPKLFEDGHDVVVVTSREMAELYIAEELAAARGLALEFISTGYGKSKADAVNAIGLGVYIDDDLDKLIPLRGIVPHLFLFSWGYNERVDESGVALRIHSWKEFYEKISFLYGTP